LADIYTVTPIVPKYDSVITREECWKR